MALRDLFRRKKKPANLLRESIAQDRAEIAQGTLVEAPASPALSTEEFSFRQILATALQHKVADLKEEDITLTPTGRSSYIVSFSRKVSDRQINALAEVIRDCTNNELRAERRGDALSTDGPLASLIREETAFTMRVNSPSFPTAQETGRDR